MSAVTSVYAVLFYVATALLVLGLARKIWQYARTPQPLKIPTTPAPTTVSGVVWRTVKEVTVFSSLFKSNKWIWLFGWMFHFALLLVLMRHLRYFQDPVWFWVPWVQPFGKYASFAMVAGLAGLWARRILVDRVRYITSPSDHLILLLLISIGLSGMIMKFYAPAHTDIIAVKQFFIGLMTFHVVDLTPDPVLLVHLALVATLMIIFPISKLLHVPGVFFSPTRMQIDNPREKRYVSGWTAGGQQ
jgi:nitrate reductase gamma subunit